MNERKMGTKDNKMNLINGSITIIIGVAIIIWGPIEFRGFPVNRSVGIIICIFGITIILIEVIRKGPKKKSSRRKDSFF